MNQIANSDPLYSTYLKTQRQLWDQWMEIAQRFEIAIEPDLAWWSFPFRALDKPARNARDVIDVHKAWLQLWRDSLSRGQGILPIMIEWNRRIVAQQARANEQFLTAWTEAVRNFGGDKWDESTQQAFEALRDAAAKALAVTSKGGGQLIEPSGESVPDNKPSREAALKKIA